MKFTVPLIVIITLVALVAAWIVIDGPARTVDKLFKRGFDASATEKIRIHEQFRGTWKLVNQIDETGGRQSPGEKYFLSINEGEMTKWRVNEPETPLSTASVYISDRGTVWESDARTIRGKKLATLRIDGEELHVVNIQDSSHEIYVRADSSR